MKNRLRAWSRVIAVLALMPSIWLTATPALAQKNAPEAVEAARRHRAQTGGQRSSPSPTSSSWRNPYRSTANPNADPDASLKSCMDHVGMNPVARDRCMRQHCEGHWGQGDCPAGGNVLGTTRGHSNTPLGKCLTQAGKNPFKRNACGWQHCKMDWSTPECAGLAPDSRQPRN